MSTSTQQSSGQQQGASGSPTPPAGGDGAQGTQQQGQQNDQEQQTFTQADVDAAVDKIAAKIRAEERRKASEKYGDYNDLKKAAEAKKTAEDRIADLEREVEATKTEALKRHIQAAHGISDEDADLFLTGTDEESLTAQAKRLAEREGTRKKKGPVVPGEGHTPNPPQADEMRQFARNLFGRSD